MREKITDYPHLMEEWDWEKNGELGLNPEKITAGSGKKAWWVCKEGHKWSAVINDRVKGHKCPYCSNRVAVSGVNDLQTARPDIAAEWHPTRNGNLTPEMFLAGSGKKVWWLCKKCSHEWLATINHRTNGRGCPYCANLIVVSGKNDLQTKFPEIAAQWHPTKNKALKPDMVVPGSTKKVWWLCNKCGYVWRSRIDSRINSKSCPCCMNRILVSGKNDLQTKFPEIAAQWHPTKNGNFRPSNVIPGSSKKAWWLCDKCGYEWQAPINKRTIGHKCPCCTNKVVIPNINDLQTKFPEIAAQLHPTKNGNLTASQLLSSSSKKVWWLCPDCGHEWYTEVRVRTNGSGCPGCIKYRKTSFPEQAIYYYIKQVFPDAINRYTELGFELDIYIPSIKTAIEYDGTIFHKNRAKKDYDKNKKCKKHEINLIRVREQGLDVFDNCFCIIRENNKTESLIMAIIQLFKYFDIGNININFDEDSLRINEKCKGALYKNSFAECFPELAKEWHPTKNGNLTPYMFSKNSGQHAWWLCSVCGYEWKSTFDSRANGHGCHECAKKKSTESRLKTLAQKKSKSLKTA